MSKPSGTCSEHTPPKHNDGSVGLLEKALFGDRPTPVKDKPVEAAAALPLVAPVTCGSCRHWKPNPKAPIPKGVAVELDKLPHDNRGQCRLGPPHATVLMLPNGQVYGQASQYPDLPADFLACDEHGEKNV